MRVLILSTGTGEGHNSASKAIKEQFDKHNIYCELVDVLSFASNKTSSRSRKIYIWSTVKAKGVFKGAYKAGRFLSNSYFRSPVYYANALYSKKLCAYIVENNFDTVVMPHLFPAEALTYLVRKNKVKVKTYFVATDYTCIPFTEETRTDYYFIPHEDLKAEFIKRGIPSNKLIVSGIPISDKFKLDIKKEDAREKLAIPLDKKIILLMTGSMGFGNIMSLSQKIVDKISDDTYLYIMGGTNEELKEQLRNKYQDFKRVTVLDYTNNTYLYMKASDILFTKPGGLTSSEALACNIPLVHTLPIPGCENRNVEFFVKHGLSLSGKNDDEIVNRGIDLLYDEDKQNLMLKRQKDYIKNDGAAIIFNFIIGDNRNV